MTFILFQLLIPCAIAFSIRAVTTFHENAFLITDSQSPITARNRELFIQYVQQTRQKFNWIVYLTGNCSVVWNRLSFIECFQITPFLTSFQFKLPYINRLLLHAKNRSREKYILFTNFGIVQDGDVYSVVARIREQVYEPHIFMTSYALAIWLDKQYEMKQALETLPQRVYPFPGWACEWFLVDRTNPMLAAMPPFLVARPRWDNWILQYAAVHPMIAAIDTSDVIRIFHLEHGETADTAKDIKSLENQPGLGYNLQISESAGSHAYGNIECMRYKMLSNSTIQQTPNRCRSLGWFNQNAFSALSDFYGNAHLIFQRRDRSF